MDISFYTPNSIGPESYYTIDPAVGVKSLMAKDVQPASINGWLLKARVKGGGELCWICFGRDGGIFFDVGHGPENFSNGEISFQTKNFFNSTTIHVAHKGRASEIVKITTPFSRYLFNDGMFPDDVEPLKAVINRLQNLEERQRLERALSSGIGLKS